MSCVEVAPVAYPNYRGPEEALASVFAEEPIVWVRVHDFQVQSLKAVASRVLVHLPSRLRSRTSVSPTTE